MLGSKYEQYANELAVVREEHDEELKLLSERSDFELKKV